MEERGSISDFELMRMLHVTHTCESPASAMAANAPGGGAAIGAGPPAIVNCES